MGWPLGNKAESVTGEMVVKLRILVLLGIMIGGAAASLAPLVPQAAEPAAEQKSEVSAEAIAALQRMGHSLSARDFSFQARTIRVFAGPKGEPLHIFHTLDVTVQRPNRMLVVRNGDDGP